MLRVYDMVVKALLIDLRGLERFVFSTIFGGVGVDKYFPLFFCLKRFLLCMLFVNKSNVEVLLSGG